MQNDPATQRRGSKTLIHRSSHPPSVSRRLTGRQKVKRVNDQLFCMSQVFIGLLNVLPMTNQMCPREARLRHEVDQFLDPAEE
jgi:hypothetical protein